jgi:hypothetical protein
MKTFSTVIKAINPMNGELATFIGPNIEALSRKLAFKYCQNNGLGYCDISGELILEIPCDENFKADFGKEIEYKDLQLN